MPLGSSLIIETVWQYVRTAYIWIGMSSMYSRDTWFSDRQWWLSLGVLSQAVQLLSIQTKYRELINASIPISHWLRLIQWASRSIIDSKRLAAEVANQVLIGWMNPWGKALAFLKAIKLHLFFQRHVSAVGKGWWIRSFKVILDHWSSSSLRSIILS